MADDDSMFKLEDTPFEEYALSAFGEAWGEPSLMVGVLRAQALSSGASLHQGVSALHQSASIVAGHAWCVLASRSSLRDTSGLDTVFLEAAARILACAAGELQNFPPVPLTDPICPPGVIDDVSLVVGELQIWASSQREVPSTSAALWAGACLLASGRWQVGDRLRGAEASLGAMVLALLTAADA